MTGEWSPQIGLDINTAVSNIIGDLREVLLSVTVSAKQGDQTMFLVEVKQAGAFLMQNLTEPDFRRAVGSGLPGGAVSVRARGGFSSGQPGRLSAIAAAAGQLRNAVRLQRRCRGERPRQELTRGRRAALTDRGAGRRLVGHGAGHPVRTRRTCGAAVGPRRGALRGDGSARASISAICRAALFPDGLRVDSRAAGGADGRRRRADRGAQSRVSRTAERGPRSSDRRPAPVLGHQGL